jgi:hypothetical protein
MGRREERDARRRPSRPREACTEARLALIGVSLDWLHERAKWTARSSTRPPGGGAKGRHGRLLRRERLDEPGRAARPGDAPPRDGAALHRSALVGRVRRPGFGRDNDQQQPRRFWRRHLRWPLRNVDRLDRHRQRRHRGPRAPGRGDLLRSSRQPDRDKTQQSPGTRRTTTAPRADLPHLDEGARPAAALWPPPVFSPSTAMCGQSSAPRPTTHRDSSPSHCGGGILSPQEEAAPVDSAEEVSVSDHRVRVQPAHRSNTALDRSSPRRWTSSATQSSPTAVRRGRRPSGSPLFAFV